MLFTSYKKKEDEHLMILVKKGDHRAFSALFDRYSGRLKAFFYRMLWSDEEMAEDYVQELFTKIIHKPELFTDGMRFKPWVFQVASNMCKNAYRKKAFEMEYLNQLEASLVQLPTAERRIDEKISLERIYRFVDSLDEEKRDLFVMKYQQELTLKEIAEVYRVPEGTIKSRLHNLKNKLVDFVNVSDKEMRRDHGSK